MNKIIGTAQRDQLIGTSLDDIILGLGGDDIIEGGLGSDTLNGGNGNDSIAGSAFPLPAPILPPIVDDGPETDELTLVPIDLGDLIKGGKGNDTIAGGQGDDTIRSGVGDDLVYGGEAPRLPGIEPIAIGIEIPFPFPIPPFPLDDGADRIFAGAGNDTIFGGSGSDTVLGGQGNDLIVGGSPPVAFPLRPVEIEDIIIDPNVPVFDDLGDQLRGGGGADTLLGGSGADTLFGGNGDDSINGGIGADWLHGNAGADTLKGESGNDTVRGGIGDDILFGGVGNDQVIGGSGDDSLTGVNASIENPGQLERDTFTGGRGSDRFILGDAKQVFYDDSQIRFIQAPPANEPPPSYGLITDFELGQDVIQLNGAEQYELRKVDLSGDAFGLGIYFNANTETKGAQQLIGIIQSDDDLSGIVIQTAGDIAEIR